MGILYIIHIYRAHIGISAGATEMQFCRLSTPRITLNPETLKLQTVNPQP